jgi:DNA polymerase III subunit gamma/tau
VRTLRNAVERGKVHHAYLFVGSRGTGKTSMAKILAACLNCEHGPTIEPCGRCESCRSIASATSLDVIEMDAASNNSVDDIRELRESVAYAPVSGRRKVYILDEAHMLSTAAWNAFLKTLEEPPPNTVFVLATTEAMKVPATVVDRCHRFDFHRPTVEQIASVVRRTAAAEAIEIPPPAVAAVARSATGSFRDALGTLEQIVTYSGQSIALEDVLAVLGVADSRLLEETVAAVAAGDAGRALRALEECVEQGRDAGSFATELEVRARELLVVQTLGEVPGELSLTPEADAALQAQAANVEHAAVVRLLELLGEAMEAVRAGADPRTRLELALVKAARPEVDGSTRALLARIERLEAARPAPAAGPPAAPSASAPATPLAAQESAAPAPRADPDPPAADQRATDPPAAHTPAAHTPAAHAPATDPPATDPRAEAAATEAAATHADSPSPPSPPAPEAYAAGERQPVAVASPPTATGTETAEPAAAPQDGGVPGAVAATGAVGDLESMLAVWPAVVELVRSEHALLGALIAEARPAAVEGEDLTLAFAATAQFLKKKAEDPANRMAVGEALRALTSQRWRLSYELREDELGLEGEAQPSAGSEEEWVRRFIDEFDAEEVADERSEPGEQPVHEHVSTRDLERDVEAVTSNEKGA